MKSFQEFVRITEESEAKRKRLELKKRKLELALQHGLDMTNADDMRKLTRLMSQSGRQKAREAKGDTRTPEEYRKDKAQERKDIDAVRQGMKQREAKPGSAKRREIDRKLKRFRDEYRSTDPTFPSTAQKQTVKVGTKVPMPPSDVPKTGYNVASKEILRQRREYKRLQKQISKEEEK